MTIEEGGRRFRVADAAVLAAALGLAAALLRAGAGSESFEGLRATVVFGMRIAPDGPVVLTILSVALVALGLSGPGPGWRARLSRPGLLACAIATATLGFDALDLILYGATRAEGVRDLIRHAVERPWGSQPHFSFRPILGAWLALWASGRWTAPGDWVERAGRLVGFAWQALGVVVSVRRSLSALIERLGQLVG